MWDTCNTIACQEKNHAIHEGLKVHKVPKLWAEPQTIN